ncbi:MAG: hypothetical protein KC417_10160, partial [Myxococcales bacterium]|nr:hypothetical protein [Myxococcales bacterium]
LRDRWLLFVPPVLYAAAITNYVLPDTFDNLIYLNGARAIHDTGEFTFGGWFVWDWPPGFAFLLSLAAGVGFGSVAAAKVVVCCLVSLAVAAAYRLLERGEWRHPLASAVIAALAPYAFLQGTRVMADWPYVAIAMAFLLVLGALDGKRRGVGLAVLAGALLAASALVRHVGVVLGAAVVAQAWTRFRARGSLAWWRAPALEVLVAALGGGSFLAPKLRILPAVRAGAAWSEYQEGTGFLFHPDLVAWARLVLDVLSHGTSLAARAPVPSPVVSVAALAVSSFMVAGLIAKFRRSGATPVWTYTVANLVLILLLEWKWSRYLLPVAPFVVSAFLEGVELLSNRIPARVRAFGPAALVVWGVMLFAMDTTLLVRGNGVTHRGLSAAVSDSPERFYLGEWNDLYRACAVVRDSNREGGVIVLDRADLKYVAHWCERPVIQGEPLRRGGDFWRRACGMRAPFAPGTGLALRTKAGRAPEPWPAPSTLSPQPLGDVARCQGSFVLSARNAPLPPGAPPAEAIATFGDLRLTTLSPQIHEF